MDGLHLAQENCEKDVKEAKGNQSNRTQAGNAFHITARAIEGPSYITKTAAGNHVIGVLPGKLPR
jgi:hypothetical protein